MSQDKFRLFLVFVGTILIAGFIWIGGRMARAAEDAAEAAEDAAENGKFEQIDVIKYGGGRISSDGPSFFNTRTGEKYTP